MWIIWERLNWRLATFCTTDETWKLKGRRAHQVSVQHLSFRCHISWGRGRALEGWYTTNRSSTSNFNHGRVFSVWERNWNKRRWVFERGLANVPVWRRVRWTSMLKSTPTLKANLGTRGRHILARKSPSQTGVLWKGVPYTAGKLD